MKLPDHVFAEDLASLDQQQLLPIKAASSKQPTGMQVEPAQWHVRNHVIKHTQLNLLQSDAQAEYHGGNGVSRGFPLSEAA